MKKILMILMLGASLIICKADLTITPIWRFPNTPSPLGTWLFILSSSGLGNYNISVDQWSQYESTNSVFLNSLLANTNIVNSIINNTNFINSLLANTNIVNQILSNTNILNTVYNTILSNTPAIESGNIIQPTTRSATTNNYVFDFGLLTTNGQQIIYSSLLATNNCVFTGITNCNQWKLLSVNVVASGANRDIYIPNTFAHFITNGWNHTSSYYYLTLTNGNEFRLTLQSNLTFSTTWATFGQ